MINTNAIGTVDIKSIAIEAFAIVRVLGWYATSAVLFGSALETARIGLVAWLALALAIDVVTVGAGETCLGVADVTVWGFEGAGGTKFGLAILVIARFAVITDMDGSTGQAVSIKCFAW